MEQSSWTKIYFVNVFILKLHTYNTSFFQGALSSSTVGSIVGLQSEEISQIASEYAERVCT